MKTIPTLLDFYRFLYPMPCALITTQKNAMVVAWHTPLSFNPQIYGVAIAPKRATHEQLLKEKEFGVNFVTKEYLKELWYCGSHTGRQFDKIKESGFTFEKAEKIKSLLIKEAFAVLECKLIDSKLYGDHTLFVGDVLSARAEESYLENILKYKKPYQIGGRKFTEISDEVLEG